MVDATAEGETLFAISEILQILKNSLILSLEIRADLLEDGQQRYAWELFAARENICSG